MYFKLFKFSLLLGVTSSLLSAHIYFNGNEFDQNNIPRDGWRVYDNSPAGATAEIIYDEEKYIKLEGEGRSNAYILGNRKSSSGHAWKDGTNYIFSWKMKVNEKYRITLYTETKKGSRRFNITYKRKDKGLYKKRYIGIGLGKKSMDGTWQTFEIDLKAKLKQYEPDNQLITVNGIKVRGSALFDDIELNAKEFIANDTAHKVQYVCQNHIKDESVKCDDDLNIGYSIESYMADRGINRKISAFDIPTATELTKAQSFEFVNSIDLFKNTSLLKIDFNRNMHNHSGIEFFYIDTENMQLKSALNISQGDFDYIYKDTLKLFDSNTKLSIMKLEEKHDPENGELLPAKKYEYIYDIRDTKNIKLISKTEVVK